ncbi:MAG TPA: glycosyltransferase [Anaerolineales bacterium]|nr:glycosyltransferase [Anaerolineales bacterium]
MKRITKITVAIPTLNRPDALARCLEALLVKGTVLPAEVLIVNQGEYYAAEQVINCARLNSPAPIVHCSQPKKGLSAARNLASIQAHCRVIAFTDDDCVPAPDWLETIERTMATNPSADGVTGSILPLGDESAGLFPISIRTNKKGKTFQGHALPWHVGSGGNFAIRRDWLFRVRGYDERLGAGSPGKAAEDTDLFYRLLLSGAVIRYEPEVVISHERQDAARLIRSFWNYSYGIGAFTAKHFRAGDPYAIYLLGVWLFWLIWRTGSSILRRRKMYIGEGWLSLKGCSHGLAYGFKLR